MDQTCAQFVALREAHGPAGSFRLSRYSGPPAVEK
jgi:hypothetical protein